MSVNSRTDMDQCPEMFCGWCMFRAMHFIISLRLAHPDQRTFISKYDCSDAHRRMAHSARATAQSIAVPLAAACIALRLTFGGSPNLPLWCLFSEMVTDLANEIANSSSYDPSILASPSQPKTPAQDCHAKIVCSDSTELSPHSVQRSSSSVTVPRKLDARHTMEPASISVQKHALVVSATHAVPADEENFS
jgi:hypothetical protein